MFFYLSRLIKILLLLDFDDFVNVLFVFFKKGFYNSQCMFCTVALNFIKNLLKLIIISSWGFKNWMSCTFACDLFWCTSLYATELLWNAVIKIFFIAETFHGRRYIFRKIQSARKIKTLQEILSVFDNDHFLNSKLLFRELHIFGIQLILKVKFCRYLSASIVD